MGIRVLGVSAVPSKLLFRGINHEAKMERKGFENMPCVHEGIRCKWVEYCQGGGRLLLSALF